MKTFLLLLIERLSSRVSRMFNYPSKAQVQKVRIALEISMSALAFIAALIMEIIDSGQGLSGAHFLLGFYLAFLSMAMFLVAGVEVSDKDRKARIAGDLLYIEHTYRSCLIKLCDGYADWDKLSNHGRPKGQLIDLVASAAHFCYWEGFIPHELGKKLTDTGAFVFGMTMVNPVIGIYSYGVQVTLEHHGLSSVWFFKLEDIERGVFKLD